MRCFNVISALNLGEKNDVLNEQHKSFGNAGISINANPLNGNLFVKDHMFTYVDRGVSLQVGMVYNSQSEKPWRLNLGKQICQVNNPNGVGSKLELVEEDGHKTVFEYDSKQGCYLERGAGNTARRFKKEGDGWNCFNPTTGQQDHYDASLKIQKTISPNGASIDYGYDAQGRIIKVLTNSHVNNDSPQYLEIDYKDSQIKLWQVSGKKKNNLATYELDKKHRLTKTNIPLSEKNAYETSYQYNDKDGLLSKVAQSDNTSVSFEFIKTSTDTKIATICDGEKRAYHFNYHPSFTNLVDPVGGVCQYQVDENGCLQASTDGLHSVIYSYDGKSRVEKAVYQDNTFDYYTYDQLGLCSSFTNRSGSITQFNYSQATDSGRAGLLLSKTVVCREDDAKSTTTFYIYNDKRQLCYKVNPVGCVKKYDYDPLGNRTACRVFKESYLNLANRAADNYLYMADMQTWEKVADKSQAALTEWRHNERGQVDREITYASINAKGQGIYDQLTAVTLFAWDSQGNCTESVKRLDENNNAIEIKKFDALSRLTYVKDAVGREVTHQYKGSSHHIQTLATGLEEIVNHDHAGHVAGIISCADSTIRTNRKIFDAAGRCAIIKGTNGLKQYRVYDEYHRKQFEIDEARKVTAYLYDSNDNIIQEIVYAEPIASVNENELLAGKWKPIPQGKFAKLNKQYDAEGRLWLMVDAEGYATHFKYDSLGNLTDKILYKNVAITPDGNLLTDENFHVRLPTPTEDDRHYRYFYNKDGSMQAEQDALGQITVYKRNKMSEIVEKKHYATPHKILDTFDEKQVATSLLDRIDIYKLDAKGQCYEHQDAEKYITLKTHDAAGRGKSVHRGESEVKYEFDALDRVVVESNQSGLEIKKQYHANGQLAFEERRDKYKDGESRQLLQQYNGYGQKTNVVTDKNTILKLQAINYSSRDELILHHPVVQKMLLEPITPADDSGLWARLHNEVTGKDTFDLDSARSLLAAMVKCPHYSSGHVLPSVTEAIYFAKTYCDVIRTIILKAHWRTYWGGKWRTQHAEGGLLPNDIHVLPAGHFQVEEILQKMNSINPTNDYHELAQINESLKQVMAVLNQHYENRGYWDHEETLDFYKSNLDFLAGWTGHEWTLPSSKNEHADNPDVIALRKVYSIDGLCVATCDAENNRTYYYYDELKRPIITIDPRGAVVENEYDVYTNTVKSERIYNERLSIAQLKPLSGGLLEKSIHDLIISLRSNKDETRLIEHDKRGLVVNKEDGEGFREAFKYNAFGELEEHEVEIKKNKRSTLETFKRDKKGRVIERVADAKGEAVKETDQYHDQLGEVVHTDSAGHVSKSYYDKLNRLIRKLDALNNESITQWDELSRIKKEINALKQETNYTWRNKGRIVCKENLSGSISTEINAYGEETEQAQTTGDQEIKVTKQYDDHGRVTAIIMGALGTTNFIYDTNGRLEFKVSPTGSVTKYVRNEAGQVEKQIEDFDGVFETTTVFRRDSQGRIEAKCDSQGVWTTYQYNLRGDEVEAIIDVDGLHIVTTKEYDGLHHLIEKTVSDAEDKFKQKFNNDNLGRCTAEQLDPDNLNITTETNYDRVGNIKSITDPNGKVTWLFHDALSRERFRIAADGFIYEKQYDAIGNCIYERVYANKLPLEGIEQLNLKLVEEAVSNNISDQDSATYYLFDQHKKPSYKISVLHEEGGEPKGVVEQFVYDHAGREIKHICYDKPIELYASMSMADSLASQHDILESSPNNRAIHRYYDAASQERFTIDETGAVTEKRYNELGKVTSTIQYASPIDLMIIKNKSTLKEIIDEVGSLKDKPRAKHRVYDHLGRKIFSVSAMGYVRAYEYNNNGKRTSTCSFKYPILVPETYEDLVKTVHSLVVDPEQDSIRTVDYDQAGRSNFAKDEMGYQDHYENNALGRIKTHTDRNGDVWENVHDGANRQIKEISPEITIAVVKKTEHGELTHEEKKLKVVNKTEFDKVGNASSTSFADNIAEVSDGAEKPRLVKTNHDAIGRVIGTVLPDATVTKDSLVIKKDITNNIIRDHAGRPVMEVAANGGKLFTAYDQLGRKRFTLDAEGYVVEYS